MSAPASRYPFEPFFSEAGAPTIGVLAGWVGVSRRTIHRWANDGVPERSADRAAIAINSHPAYIWPEQWSTAA